MSSGTGELSLEIYEDHNNLTDSPNPNTKFAGYTPIAKSKSVIVSGSGTVVFNKFTELGNDNCYLLTHHTYYAVIKIISNNGISIYKSSSRCQTPEGGAGNNYGTLDHTVKVKEYQLITPVLYNYNVEDTSVIEELVNDEIVEINDRTIINHNPTGTNVFFAQVPGDNYNNGGYGGEGKVAVTMEARHLLVTQELLDELKISEYPTLSFIDNNDGVVIDEYVNIYLVYLNNNGNFRDDFSEVTFQNDILAVGILYDQTLHFSGSRFGEQHYPSESTVELSGKLEDRRFEPKNFNNGSQHSSWNNSGSGYDWFDVTGNDRTFQLGCKNGEKGDFFRVITKSGGQAGGIFSGWNYATTFLDGIPSNEVSNYSSLSENTSIIEWCFSNYTIPDYATSDSIVSYWNNQDITIPFSWSVSYNKNKGAEITITFSYNFTNQDSDILQHLLFFQYLPDNVDSTEPTFQELYEALTTGSYSTFDTSQDSSGTITKTIGENEIFGFLIDSTIANAETLSINFEIV